MPEFYMHDTEIYLSLTDGRIGYSWRVGNFDETKLLTKAVILWDQDVVKGSRKKMKILIVSQLQMQTNLDITLIIFMHR